jgi:PEP-CTERM motif
MSRQRPIFSRFQPLATAWAAAMLAMPAGAATCTWLGSSGSWDDPSAWNCALIPGAADTAILNAGSVAVTNSTNLGRLTLGRGQITGAGTLTVVQGYTLNGGSVLGNGVLELAASGDIGDFYLDDSRVVNNRSTARWANGTLYFNILGGGGGGGVFNNTSGARFELQTNDLMGNWSGTSGLFNNAGDFIKTGGTGTSTIGVRFNNSSVVRADTGNLLFSGGGVHSAGASFTGAGAGRVTIGTGVHSFAAGSSLQGNLAFSGFNVNTDIATINGSLSASNINMGSSAHVVLNSNGSTGAFTMGSSRLAGSGTLAVGGNHAIDGGAAVGGGVLELQSSGSIGTFYLDDTRVLRNRGTTVWNGGPIYFNILSGADEGGVIHNAAGARFEAQADNVMANWSGSSGVFNNEGALVKTGGSGTSTINVRLNNSGSVRADSGNLQLGGGGTHSAGASVVGGSGGRVTIGTGVHSFEAGSSLSGNLGFAGFNVNSDITTLNGSLAASTINMGNSAHVVLNSNGSTGALTVGSARLGGSGTLSVSGSHNIDGGVFVGDSTLRLEGSGSVGTMYLDDNATVHNSGVTRWGSGSIYFNILSGGGAGGVINNSGSFEAQANQVMGNWSGTSGVFNNSGSFSKTGGSSTAVNVRFNNSGTVLAGSGNLQFGGGGTHAAGSSFTGGPGAVVTIGTGEHRFEPGSRLSGNLAFTGFNVNTDITTINGTLAASSLNMGSSANVVLNTAGSAQALVMGSARLGGSGNLVVSGNHNLDGAVLVGSGLLELQGGGSIGTLYLDDSRVVNNRARSTWGSGSIYFNILDGSGAGGVFNNLAGAVFENTGSLTMGNWSGTSGVFNNTGLFVKSGSASTTNIGNRFTNSSGGVIDVRNGALVLASAFDNQATVKLAAGATFHVNNATFVNNGLIEGEGTLRTLAGGGLRNNGTLATGGVANSGTLSVDGDLELAGTGSVVFELAGNQAFDRLAVLDDITLGGTLQVLGLAGFTPNVGDSFTIITFDERLQLSTFANFVVSGFDPGVYFDVVYNAGDVTLIATTIPEPGSWALWLAGLGVLSQLARRTRRA